MISAPRIRPPARPTSASTPETIFVTKPSATAGDVSSAAARASSSAASIDVEVVARVVQRRIDRVADLVPLLDDSPRRLRPRTMVIKAIRPRTTRPAARVGLSPRRSSFPTNGLEDHGQNGREDQRKHDLAHRGQCGDDDERRRDKSDEGPGPDPDLGKRGSVLHHDRLMAFTRGGANADRGSRSAAPLDPVRKPALRPPTP